MNVQVDDGLSGCGQQSMVGVIRAFGNHGFANKQYQVDQPGRFHNLRALFCFVRDVFR